MGRAGRTAVWAACGQEGFRMAISGWMVSMFFLGIGAMALCLLFLKACEKI